MDIDAYLLELLSTTAHKQEALAWLQQKDRKERTIGDQDKAASLQLVQDLYARGAEEVTAVDIETTSRQEMTSALIVKLPPDPVACKKVFEAEAKVARQMGVDPTMDEGQQYLLLQM